MYEKNRKIRELYKQYKVVEKIGVKGYLQRHLEECKCIWRNMVPKSGQVNNIQGEMLRMVIKLRNEVMNNENINLDDIYNYLEDAIAEYYLVHKAPII